MPRTSRSEKPGTSPYSCGAHDVDVLEQHVEAAARRGRRRRPESSGGDSASNSVIAAAVGGDGADPRVLEQTVREAQALSRSSDQGRGRARAAWRAARCGPVASCTVMPSASTPPKVSSRDPIDLHVALQQLVEQLLQLHAHQAAHRGADWARRRRPARSPPAPAEHGPRARATTARRCGACSKRLPDRELHGAVELEQRIAAVDARAAPSWLPCRPGTSHADVEAQRSDEGLVAQARAERGVGAS